MLIDIQLTKQSQTTIIITTEKFNTDNTTMHFLFTTLLLLLTTTISTNAKPLPYFRSAAAAHFHEIERRWSEGQSEVCRLGPPLPGCYVLAWVQDLLVRDDVSSWSTAPQPMMDQQSVEVMIEDV